jgi:FeS assembly SUF system regulator
MLRMTKQTDYGIVLLIYMSQHGTDVMHNARDLAQATGLPLPMVSKILKALARGEVLQSHRGTKGGYGLARPAQRITVTQIIEALEGPIALTECVGDLPSSCSVQSLCPVRVSWRRVNHAIRHALDEITLLEMAEPLARPPSNRQPDLTLEATT